MQAVARELIEQSPVGAGRNRPGQRSGIRLRVCRRDDVLFQQLGEKPLDEFLRVLRYVAPTAGKAE